MLEETGTVIDTDGEHVWIETQARSACTHCGTASCSTSVIARLFGVKRNRLRVFNSLRARPGQQVVVGVPDEVVVAVSLRAYLFPLLVMLCAAALAGAAGLHDALQALVAVGGLVAGLLLAGRAAGDARAQQRYAPRLLRLTPGRGFEFELTDLTRKQP